MIDLHLTRNSAVFSNVLICPPFIRNDWKPELAAKSIRSWWPRVNFGKSWIFASLINCYTARPSILHFTSDLLGGNSRKRIIKVSRILNFISCMKMYDIHLPNDFGLQKCIGEFMDSCWNSGIVSLFFSLERILSHSKQTFPDNHVNGLSLWWMIIANARKASVWETLSLTP